MTQKVQRVVRDRPLGRWRRLRDKIHLARRASAQQPVKLNFGADLRRQRQKLQRQSALVRIRTILRPLLKPALVLVVIAAALGAGIYLIRNLSESETYIVQDIVVSGNEEISDLEIVSAVQDVIGKSMFSFDTNVIEATLRSKFPFIKAVYARKVLPGVLEIEVEERKPALAFVDLSGVFLIDSERVVVDNLYVDERPALTADQLLVVNGYGDPNALYVYEHYLSKIESEEERKEVKWEEVMPEDKAEALTSLRGELLLDIATRLASNISILRASDYASLMGVEAQTNEVYELGSLFPEKQFLIVTSVNDYMTKRGIGVARYLWTSDFSLHVSAGGKDIIFTTTRDIKTQLQALEAVRAQTNWAAIRIVDLQSELVAVQ